MSSPQDLMSGDKIVVESSSEPILSSAPKPVEETKLSKLTIDTIAGLRVAKPTVDITLNMLVYGDPGVGKTRLAGSACIVPEMSPVLLLDFEGGTLSLAGDYNAVDVWPDPKDERRPTWKDIDKLYGQLYAKNPYRTIILDSITEVQKFCLSEIMKQVVQGNPDRDPDIASLREWGKQSEQLRRLVRALRDLPCNTIFTALRHDEKDDKGNLIKTRPALPGQLKGEVAGYVDIVVYMYQKEFAQGPNRTMKTLLLTQGTEKQIAKDRSGKLPPIMEAVTMQNIYNLVNGRDSGD